MLLMLSLGVFIYFSASLVFLRLAGKYKYFVWLAILALIQGVDFTLYFLPENNLVTELLVTFMYGNFYWCGPLFMGFSQGLLFVKNKTKMARHLLFAAAASIVVSGLAWFSRYPEFAFITRSLLDFVSVPLPMSLFTLYLTFLLKQENQWPHRLIYQFTLLLAVLAALTVLIHLGLLAGWFGNIWRIVIPTTFAISLYGFFIVVLFTVPDLKGVLGKSQRKSTIAAGTRQEISQQVKQYLSESSAYRDSQLKLQDVAKATGFSERQVSESINLEHGVSFQNLLNQYRLNYVTDHLSSAANSDHKNLLELALDAGFGSKTAFNRYFKTVHGIPPKLWSKQLAQTSKD